MGRGSSKLGGSGGAYIRFGDLPTSGKSLNYLALSASQREDMTDLMEDGRTPEEAVEFAKKYYNSWKNVDTDAIFETGVSVFKMDADGLPKIESLQQAQSVANRIGDTVFSVSGKKVGIGQDGEPLLSNAKGKTISVSDTKMQDKIINTLKKNFAESEGKKNVAGDANKIYEFTDLKTGQKEISYMGITFKKPKSNNWK